MYLKGKENIPHKALARRGERRPSPARWTPGSTPRFTVLFGTNRRIRLLQIRYPVARSERTVKKARSLEEPAPGPTKAHLSSWPRRSTHPCLGPWPPSNHAGRLRPPGCTIATVMKRKAGFSKMAPSAMALA